MTRDLSQTSFGLVAGEAISFAVLLELAFDSAPVRLWSGWVISIGTGKPGSAPASSGP